MTNALFQSIESRLEPILPQNRYQHSIRVAATASLLAKKWQQNPDSAYLAGLIHDVAKYMDPETVSEYAVSDPMPSLYREYPSVWHAFVGPQVSQSYFGLSDQNVLSAAKWHTTGRADMLNLDKILFVSDYIEPGRHFFDRCFIEQLAYKNLDEAVLLLSSVTLVRLIEKGLPIHPDTYACRDYYLKQVPSKCAKHNWEMWVALKNEV